MFSPVNVCTVSTSRQWMMQNLFVWGRVFDGLILLTIMFFFIVYLYLAWIRFLFLKAEQYSTVCILHFVQSYYKYRYRVSYPFESLLSILLRLYPWVVLVDYILLLHLMLEKFTCFFPMVPSAFYSPSNHAHISSYHMLFHPTLPLTYFFFLNS